MDVLFVCCDAGETKALIPVMAALQETRFSFNVLAMGAAIAELQKVASLKDFVIELKEPVDTVNGRNRPLENIGEDIEQLRPKLLISGPASKAQEQLLQAISAPRKIVYLDNFNYATASLYFGTVKGVVSEAQKIICVTDIVKKQILAIDQPGLRTKDVKPLGRPSLETWVCQVQGVDKAAVVQKIGFNENLPIVTFIGGYGFKYDNGVNQAYHSAETALTVAGYQVHRQHHPNIVKEQPLETFEAVGMADCIVCYDSTVGFEALFAGKKVIYLQPQDVEPYDNIAIQNQLADRVQTNKQLIDALQTAPKELKDVYATLGVKRDSTQAIVGYFQKKLNKY